MQYGLKTETVKKINTIFAKYKEVKEAVLYGSRAKGNYKPGSDIDLTLKGKQLNLKLLNKISLDLDDLLLPYTFDLSIYHHITNPDLINHIERVRKVFYKREGANSRIDDC
jgi:predicted nucleotidyltransferase